MVDGPVGRLSRGRAFGGAPAGRVALGWVAVVVVLAAAGGALLPALAQPAARAQTVVRVVVQPPVAGADPVSVLDPDAARADAVATVVALAATPTVREAVASRAGTTLAVLDAGFEVAASRDPAAGLVDVRADAPAPAEAERIVVAGVDVLAAGLERADTDALRAALGPLSVRMQDLANQLRALPPDDSARGVLEQRYGALEAVIAGRTASPAPRLQPGGAPTVTEGLRGGSAPPVATAAVAGLAALLLAVPLALLASRRRRPAGTDPAHGLTAAVPGPRAFLVWSDDAPAVLTRFWVEAVRGRGPVLVLQLSAPDRVDLAGRLVAAGRLIGDAVGHRDLTPDAPAPEPISGRALTVSALRTPVVDDAALLTLRAAAPAVVLAVDTAHTGHAEVAAAVAAVRGVEREVRGIVVWRGRLPSDPARASAAPSSPPG